MVSLWYDHGVRYVGDLFNESRKFLSSSDIKRIYKKIYKLFRLAQSKNEDQIFPQQV